CGFGRGPLCCVADVADVLELTAYESTHQVLFVLVQPNLIHEIEVPFFNGNLVEVIFLNTWMNRCRRHLLRKDTAIPVDELICTHQRAGRGISSRASLPPCSSFAIALSANARNADSGG